MSLKSLPNFKTKSEVNRFVFNTVAIFSDLRPGHHLCNLYFIPPHLQDLIRNESEYTAVAQHIHEWVIDGRKL